MHPIWVSLFLSLLSLPSFADCPIKLTEPLTEAKLQSELLSKCTFEKARDMIPHLPDSYRSNFTFMRRSAGKLGKCIQPPYKAGAILFSPNSPLIISLPWDPTVTNGINCNAFETLELEPDAIVFTHNEHVKPAIYAEAQDMRYMNAIDPTTKCESCHTSSGIPNWGSYPRWKSKDSRSEAYGFNDDQLVPGTDAARDYLLFLSKIRSDKSSNLLIWPKPPSVETVLKLRDPKLYFLGVPESDLNEYIRQIYSVPPYQYFALGGPGRENQEVPSYANFKGPIYTFRPNNNLGRVLNVLNGRRLFAKAERAPYFNQVMLIHLYKELCFPEDGKAHAIFLRRDQTPENLRTYFLRNNIFTLTAEGNLVSLVNDTASYYKDFSHVRPLGLDELGIGRLVSEVPDRPLDQGGAPASDVNYEDGQGRLIGVIDILYLQNDFDLRQKLTKSLNESGYFNPLSYRRPDHHTSAPICSLLKVKAQKYQMTITGQ